MKSFPGQRSKVKGQYRGDTKCTFAADLHFDGE